MRMFVGLHISESAASTSLWLPLTQSLQPPRIVKRQTVDLFSGNRLRDPSGIAIYLLYMRCGWFYADPVNRERKRIRAGFERETNQQLRVPRRVHRQSSTISSRIVSETVLKIVIPHRVSLPSSSPSRGLSAWL